MRRYKGSGFTLVELILVSAILSVVGIAVYAAFSNGIRLWKKINQELPQEGISIFFEEISYDLRSFVKHSTVPFSGGPDSISFATFVVSETEEGVKRDLGMVSYCFEKGEDAISREQSNYSQLYLSEPGPARRLLRGVDFLTFRYYCYDPENEKYIWLDAWNADEAPPGVNVDKSLPLSVMVEIGLEEYQGEKFCAIVPVPVGG